MAHAEFFTSLIGCFLVLYKCITKQPLSGLEIIATIITLSGSVLMNFDPNAKKVD
jgi:hypothetical protein